MTFTHVVKNATSIVYAGSKGDCEELRDVLNRQYQTGEYRVEEYKP